MFSGPSSGMFGIGCTGCMVPMIGIAGDLSLGEIGNLINPAAINLLKANASTAAKQVLGPKTSEDVIQSAVDAYVKFVIPQTNRALTVFEIAHDANFKRIAHKAMTDSKTMGDSAKGLLSHLGIIPRLAVYGGVGYGVYRGYKWYRAKHPAGKSRGWFGFGKRKSKKRRKSRSRAISSRVSTPFAAPTPTGSTGLRLGGSVNA